MPGLHLTCHEFASTTPMQGCLSSAVQWMRRPAMIWRTGSNSGCVWFVLRIQMMLDGPVTVTSDYVSFGPPMQALYIVPVKTWRG